jgi:hypothetical protein
MASGQIVAAFAQPNNDFYLVNSLAAGIDGRKGSGTVNV